MLARCGGRLALAVELAERAADPGLERRYDEELHDVLTLWPDALETDGGGPEPRAQRLLLDALEREQGDQDRLRDRYVENVARVDLDAEAVPVLMGWIRDRLRGGEPMEPWVRALRAACGPTWFRDAMSGAPAPVRALCKEPEMQPLALQVPAHRYDPPTTPEAALRHADVIDEALAEQAWRRRRTARMTMDDAKPREGKETARGVPPTTVATRGPNADACALPQAGDVPGPWTSPPPDHRPASHQQRRPRRRDNRSSPAWEHAASRAQAPGPPRWGTPPCRRSPNASRTAPVPSANLSAVRCGHHGLLKGIEVPPYHALHTVPGQGRQRCERAHRDRDQDHHPGSAHRRTYSPPPFAPPRHQVRPQAEPRRGGRRGPRREVKSAWKLSEEARTRASSRR